MVVRSAAERLEWLDVLRGTACVLVVFTHAVAFSPLFGVPVGGLWLDLIQVFDAFRMPIFFFVAGALASGAMTLPWGAFLRKRVLVLVWVYLLWSVLHALVLMVFLRRVSPNDWQQVLLAPVWPHQNLWFLWALAIYLVLARSLRPLPTWIPITLASAVAVPAASGILITAPSNPAVGKAAEYFLAFIVAVRVGPNILRAGAPSPRLAVLCVVTFLCAVEVEIRTGTTHVLGVPVLTSALAVLAGIAAAQAFGSGRCFRPVGVIGRLTLPVYCVHFLPAILIPSLFGPLVDRSALLPVWPLIGTALSLTCALLVHRCTRRVPGLWNLPGFLDPARTLVSAAHAEPTTPRKTSGARRLKGAWEAL